MIQLFENKAACFGCTACSAACPEKAISMSADGEGFLYPHVDGGLCTDCGLCREACPIGRKGGSAPDFGWAYLSANEQQRKASSSGGAFPALVREFWKRHPGADVWGACLDTQLQLVHRCVNGEELLPLLQGSKYVQSRLDDAFERILRRLEQGQWVLFSGTPCQCAGLERLAGEKRERLLLVDLVCNGAASPAAWKRCLEIEEESSGSRVENFAFRNRRYFMGRGVACTLADGRVLERSHPEDLFSACYQRNLLSRNSCYSCPYASPVRSSDISLGDFHGFENIEPQLAQRGISLLLPHSPLGQEYCAALEGEFMESYPLEQCMQPRLEAPPKAIPLRKLILRDLLSQPTKIFTMKYGKMLFPGKPGA